MGEILYKAIFGPGVFWYCFFLKEGNPRSVEVAGTLERFTENS